jgi:hypothetical protein
MLAFGRLIRPRSPKVELVGRHEFCVSRRLNCLLPPADGRRHAETERDIAAATAPTGIFIAQGFSLASRDGAQSALQRNRAAAARCGKIDAGCSAGWAAWPSR